MPLTAAEHSQTRTAGYLSRRRIGAFALLSLLTLVLPGCQSIDVNAGNVATLRVIDASPDSNYGFDVYENSVAIVYNLGFGTSTSPIAFAPGTYNIAADQAKTSTVLVSSNASLANMHAYTALISNVNASLQETILQDQNSAAPTGQIAVRILDEATKAGSVDVYLVPNNGKLSTSAPIASGLNFGTNTGYIDVPAGTYAIAIVPTGTVPSSSTATLLTASQITYAAGAARTVVILDQQYVTSPAVQVIVLSDFDLNGTTS